LFLGREISIPRMKGSPMRFILSTPQMELLDIILLVIQKTHILMHSSFDTIKALKKVVFLRLVTGRYTGTSLFAMAFEQALISV
jgi:hypothetical protein